LFLADGGHVTCASLDCPDPCAADTRLHAAATPDDPVAAQRLEQEVRLREDLLLVGIRARWWYDRLLDASLVEDAAELPPAVVAAMVVEYTRACMAGHNAQAAAQMTGAMQDLLDAMRRSFEGGGE
jgi:hypothetical protein